VRGFDDPQQNAFHYSEAQNRATISVRGSHDRTQVDGEINSNLGFKG